MEVVNGVLARARENPSLYGERQLSDAELRALATDILERSPITGTSSTPLATFVNGQVIRVIGDILDDIFAKYQRRAMAAIQVGGEEGEDEEEDVTGDDDDEDDEGEGEDDESEEGGSEDN